MDEMTGNEDQDFDILLEVAQYSTPPLGVRRDTRNSGRPAGLSGSDGVFARRLVRKLLRGPLTATDIQAKERAEAKRERKRAKRLQETP